MSNLSYKEGKLHEEALIKFIGWEEILGKVMTDAIVYIDLRDKTLFVETKSPVVARELNSLKSDIVRRINEHVGFDFINDIDFR